MDVVVKEGEESHFGIPWFSGEDSISLERGGSASPLDTSFDKVWCL